jgi:uncharacterized protein (TIGR00730 family)
VASKRICVFCGSSAGRRPAFAAAAAELGTRLARDGVGLVYGGGSVGLMGTVADAALAAGGEVLGVIPNVLSEKEVAHRGLTRLHVVKSMHERKALMAEMSDAFVALPGGFGTLDELFEAVTLVQTRKVTSFPLVLIGSAYWGGLLQWLRETAAVTGTITPADVDLLHVTDDVDEAVRLIVRGDLGGAHDVPPKRPE